jgi:hypothetical protein
VRAFNPPLIDRIAAADGNMVLVELSPHRDMDRHPNRRSPTTPFDVHFEGLLPEATGRRFYSQMIDGWVWNIWRGQVVAAGTFRALPIEETPPDQFVHEMRRWGVRHLFVWTDQTRNYLAADRRFVERWRDDRWSHFELPESDGRSVVMHAGGRGQLENLTFLGGDVALIDATEGEEVIVRANYYPAWRAFDSGREVELYANDGLMAFHAPRAGTYAIRLEYPRYRGLSLIAIVVFAGGLVALSWWRPTRR